MKTFETQIIEVLTRIADGLETLDASICKLGFNGADTRMGAIELLAKEVKCGLENIDTAISSR